MKSLLELPARDSKTGAFHVVVESPGGSQVKLAYSAELRAFTLSRPLVLGLRYPFDWGFVPSTRQPDGDPLDAMVLLDAPTYPGVVMACRALGVLQVSQKNPEGGRHRNDRVICAPEKAPRFDALEDIRQLPDRARKEIEQFFIAVTALEDKDLEILGWEGPIVAEALVDEAAKRF
jgi:inorganic pyrophosphatase